MAVSHVKTVTVADGASTQVVRPSDWNSAHMQYLTLGGNTAGASTLSGSNIVMAGGDNVTLSVTGATVHVVGAPTSQFLTTAQPPGAYLTTAAQSVHTHDYQSTGAYLTTAALSNHSHGNPTLYLTNLTGTTASASNGLSLSLSAAAPGGGGGAAISAGTVSQNTGTVIFSNSNGVSFGLSSGTLTASYVASDLTVSNNLTLSVGTGASSTNVTILGPDLSQYLTTAANSTHSHGAVSLNLSNITGAYTSASNGFTLGLTGATGGTGGGGGVAIAGSNATYTSGTALFTGAGAITVGSDTGQRVVISGPSLTQLTAGANITLSSSGNTISIIGLGASAGVAAITASNMTAASGTVGFVGSNAVTVKTSAGNVVVIDSPVYQAVGAYLTTARASNDGVGLATAGTSVTWTVNSAGISLNAGAYLTTAQPVGAYLTTAMASNAGSNFVGLNSALTANGVSATINSSGISLNVPAFLTTAANSTHTHAAYLTTARASNDAVGLNTALTGNGVAWTVNSSGLSLNVPAFLTTAANSTHTHAAYLTTARASNDGVGLNTALTGNGVAWTVNSSGLSLNVPAFLTTAALSQNSSLYAGLSTGATNATVTLNTAGIAISVAAPSAGAAQSFSAGTTSYAPNPIFLSNGNGVSFGFGAGASTSILSASVATAYQSQGAYLTTARASNDGIGTNTALTANGVSVTANSSGLSLNFPAFLTTAQSPGAYLTTAMVSNAGSNFVGLNSALTANGVSATINSSGISLNVPAFLTTAANSTHTHSQYQSTGAYLTTARASNDGIGLNTAATGVTWTVNSSGISLNAGAYLTTAAQSGHSHGNPTLNLTNLTGTTASNSAGFTLSLSAAAPGAGGGVAVGANGGTATSGTVIFSNSNGVSFGYNAGTITATVTPGAAAGIAAISASNMTATSGTVGFAGSNAITVKTSAGNVVVVDGPALTVLTAGANITLSSAGSTISIIGPSGGGNIDSAWPASPPSIMASSLYTGASGNTGGSTQWTVSGYLGPLVLERPLHFSDFEYYISAGTTAGTGSMSLGHQFGIYSLNGGTAHSLISSFCWQASMTQNSVTAQTWHQYRNTASSTYSTAQNGNVSASYTGVRQLVMHTTSQSLSAGTYYIAHIYTAKSSGSLVFNAGSAFYSLAAAGSGSTWSTGGARMGTNTFAPPLFEKGVGIFSTTTNQSTLMLPIMPAVILTSALTNTGGSSQWRYPVPIMYL